MIQLHIDNGNFSDADQIWVVNDYRDLIKDLEENKWDFLGQSMLNRITGIYGKYFGKGEVVSGHCPKLNSYKESLAAQRALDSISDYIRAQK